MTKCIILLIVAAALIGIFAPGARAQVTATKAFATAPKNIFPLLDANTRLDMIDYYNSNLATPSQNAMQGQSRITALTDRTLSVELTPASSADLFVLPVAAGDSIIGVISTIATPTPDSNISFYTKDWKPLATDKLLVKPVLADWLTDAGRKNRDEVEMMVPFLLITYTWNPASNTLTLTNNTAGFLSKDVYDIVAPYMKEQLVYTWDGRKFKPGT